MTASEQYTIVHRNVLVCQGSLSVEAVCNISQLRLGRQLGASSKPRWFRALDTLHGEVSEYEGCLM